MFDLGSALRVIPNLRPVKLVWLSVIIIIIIFLVCDSVLLLQRPHYYYYDFLNKTLNVKNPPDICWQHTRMYIINKTIPNLSTTQDGVLASIIWMIFRRNLKNSRYWRSVCINHMSDQFCHILVDQNDVDIISLHETLETVLNFTYWCIWRVKR